MSKPIGAKTSMSVGQLVAFTDAEVRALDDAMAHALADYEADEEQFRKELRSYSAFRRARAKVNSLMKRATLKGSRE